MGKITDRPAPPRAAEAPAASPAVRNKGGRDDSPLASRGSVPPAKALRVRAPLSSRGSTPRVDSERDDSPLASRGSTPRAGGVAEAAAVAPPRIGRHAAAGRGSPTAKLDASRARAGEQSRQDFAAARAQVAEARAEGLRDVAAERLVTPVPIADVRAHLAGGMEVPPAVTQIDGPLPAAVATHLGSRYDHMEDAHAVRWFPPAPAGTPAVGVLAVFDGHGSAMTAQALAREAPDIVYAHVAPALTRRDARGEPDDAAVYAAIKNAFAARRPQGAGAPAAGPTPALRTFDDLAHAHLAHGSTVAMAVIIGRHAYIAGLGDSRVTLIRRDAPAERLSTDHRPGDPRERQKIESPARGGQVYFSRGGKARVEGVLATSRAVGDQKLTALGRRADVTKVTLDPAEHLALALATDGVTDVLHDWPLGRMVKDLVPPGAATMTPRQLADAAALAIGVADQRGSRDNKTLLLVGLAPPA